MDGGRRVLRSLIEWLPPLSSLTHAHSAALSSAGEASLAAASFSNAPLGQLRTLRPAPRPAAPTRFAASFILPTSRVLALPGVGLVMLLALFGGVGLFGVTQNGEYDDFVRHNGAPRDILARMIGFPIDAVTITGQTELRESEVLAASGVQAIHSLLFLDAGAVRERLLKLSMVKSARVLKLYPNRLVIALEERRPFAMWQRDGQLSVVSSDGAVVDEVKDARFLGLPFVVGEGAEKRLSEYVALVAAAGDIGSRIKAGVLVSRRRWTLNMTNGVMVKLPEQDPEGALATLAKLQRDTRILDKDILSIDLRTPGRLAVRLTEEGVASRAALTARKSHKGSQT
jgi:cell division protein FtsQ